MPKSYDVATFSNFDDMRAFTRKRDEQAKTVGLSPQVLLWLEGVLEQSNQQLRKDGITNLHFHIDTCRVFLNAVHMAQSAVGLLTKLETQLQINGMLMAENNALREEVERLRGKLDVE